MEPENALAGGGNVVIDGTYKDHEPDHDIKDGCITVRRSIYLDQYDRVDLRDQMDVGDTVRNRVRRIDVTVFETGKYDKQSVSVDNGVVEVGDEWLCYLDLYTDYLKATKEKHGFLEQLYFGTSHDMEFRYSLNKTVHCRKMRIGAGGETYEDAITNAVEEMITMTTDKVEDEQEAQDRLDDVVSGVDDTLGGVDWSEVPDYTDL